MMKKKKKIKTMTTTSWALLAIPSHFFNQQQLIWGFDWETLSSITFQRFDFKCVCVCVCVYSFVYMHMYMWNWQKSVLSLLQLSTGNFVLLETGAQNWTCVLCKPGFNCWASSPVPLLFWKNAWHVAMWRGWIMEAIVKKKT